MNKTALSKLLDHPSKEEIISSLIIGISEKEIHDNLHSKYNKLDPKLVLSEKSIKAFKDNYLDLYQDIKNDVMKTGGKSISLEQELDLTLKNNPAYKSKILELAGQEVDIKKMLTNMLMAIEGRLSQLFDTIQNDPENFKMDRVLIEYFNALGTAIEKYQKIVIAPPDQVVQHNVTFQVIDQHISVFQEVVRKVLAQMDIETSFLFMELLNKELANLKAPTEEKVDTEHRLAEAQILNETITNKLND